MYDQGDDIADKITELEERAAQQGYPVHAIHTGPLIRRVDVYNNNNFMVIYPHICYNKTVQSFSLRCVRAGEKKALCRRQSFRKRKGWLREKSIKS